MPITDLCWIENEENMRTLIKHATLITLDESDQILKDADLAIEDHTIRSVGKADPDFEPDETIQGQDLVAMPAFYNAHTHAGMTLERGWAEDLRLDRWLNRLWEAESAVTEEDVYWGSALAAAEMIRTGTVGFADLYFWMDQMGRVVEESGMKASLAWTIFGQGTEHEMGQKSYEDSIAFVKQWQGAAGGRIRTMLGPHSPYMDPEPVLRRFVEDAHRLGVGIHTHVSESSDQLNKSLAEHHLTPVQYVDSLGMLDLPEPSLVAHVNALKEPDFEILAKKKPVVCHAPKTYMRLAMEMPELQKLLDLGVKVGLGTDGPTSASDLNMLELMRLTGMAQKFIRVEPEAMAGTQLLRLATQASAAVVGFPQAGVLAPGRPADVVVMDTRAAHWIPRHNLVAGVIYNSHPEDIVYVWCDGKLLYRKGEFLTLDYERIRWEAESRAFRMVNSPMAAQRSYR
jgi:5-methylthioadenosine/S-adenosylhomocysteine deaminase